MAVIAGDGIQLPGAESGEKEMECNGELSRESLVSGAHRKQEQGEQEEGECIEGMAKKGSGFVEGLMEAEDEDEDDDVDFNPLLVLSPSREEASSAASSQAEDEDEEVEGHENGQDISSTEVEGAEVSEGFELEDDEEFMELGSELDEEEFVDDEDDDIEEEEEEEEEEHVPKGIHDEETPNQQGWREAIEVDLRGDGDGDESVMLEHGLEGSLAAVWCTDSREALDAREKERLSDSIFDYSTKFATSQERVEEEMMMGRALEGLPELRSPRSEWEQQMDASQRRAEEEQEIADAISKRTRAHYSLADMSLDQLETFLQESDEEDYFQNVDDEEEYRKFLAAVQEKIDTPDDESKQQEKVVEEESESEDEDADFEVDIEDALESDLEEGLDGEGQKRKRGRRPETREKRRQRAKLQNKVRLLGLAKAPLRPLLPYVGSMPVNASVAERSKIMVDKANKSWPLVVKTQAPVNGFTAHQIGQLYCLIHEHVQLLVQVLAMSTLEPGREQIALDTHCMLMELVEKRESVLSWKKSAFPDFCFRPPYTHSSLRKSEKPSFQEDLLMKPLNDKWPTATDESISFIPSVFSNSGLHQQIIADKSSFSACQDTSTALLPCISSSSLLPLAMSTVSTSQSFHDCEMSTHGSHVEVDATSGASTSGPWQCSLSSPTFEEVGTTCEMENSQSHQNSPLSKMSSSLEMKLTNSCSSRAKWGQSGLPPTSGNSEMLPSEWAPTTSGPVRSLMDVAPLALVRDFLLAIDEIVQESKLQNMDSGSSYSKNEKEPLFAVQIEDQSSKSPSGQTQQPPLLQTRPLTPPFPQLRKTMAAALVESTKKQSIALVLKDVAAAIQPFLPLFNRGLFPHKAPPASTANRLLFTDAEDELLAMGLMNYNTDWKAIQQRFLPSKSVHQIFVRQKNRSSARAPENSIKAVRRMKSSPLTVEEKACIQEALKVYKYDWTKVWQFCVPHRDLAILPRQWRIALGTQKSYKSSESNKEKRRVYEAARRQAMAAQKDSPLDVKEELPIHLDKNTETWHDVDKDGEIEDAYLQDVFLGNWNSSSITSSSSTGVLPALDQNRSSATTALESKTNLLNIDGITQTVPFSFVPTVPALNSVCSRGVKAKPPHISQMYQGSRHHLNEQTVKLAPGLPPLKLPPTVRVLSQSITGDLQSLICSKATACPQFQQSYPATLNTPAKQRASVTTGHLLTSSKKTQRLETQEDVWRIPEQVQQISNANLETGIPSISNKAAFLNNQDTILKFQQTLEGLPAAGPSNVGQ